MYRINKELRSSIMCYVVFDNSLTPFDRGWNLSHCGFMQILRDSVYMRDTQHVVNLDSKHVRFT